MTESVSLGWFFIQTSFAFLINVFFTFLNLNSVDAKCFTSDTF